MIVQGRDGGLVAAGTALVTLEPSTVDEAMLLSIAARAPEALWPASLLRISLAVLLCAVELLKLRQREAFVELKAVAGPDRTGTSLPLYALAPGCGASRVIKRDLCDQQVSVEGLDDHR
jgi:hypothetical protein